ncbi:hypothetical protein ElyMa_006384200 [Elysia marginata]|uniref:Uncharacterized protein n=1 Tax=Elysia marginata TaxID=1093978 RepID=A0AAV4HRP4_9GAST|nr:hypothetical protein ElyMa_006384200 [Elysia marginata]
MNQCDPNSCDLLHGKARPMFYCFGSARHLERESRYLHDIYSLNNRNNNDYIGFKEVCVQEKSALVWTPEKPHKNDMERLTICSANVNSCLVLQCS